VLFLKKNLKRNLIGIIAVSTFLTVAIIGIQQASAGNYSCYLVYGEHYAVFSSNSMTTADSIFWSFSATNGVLLDVWILDDYNFSIYDNDGIFSGHQVSNYEGTYDSGTFDIPYEDKWYVIFVHDDSAELFVTTHVIIEVNFIGIGGDSNLGLILGIVIPVVVVIVVGAVVGSVIAKKKRQSKPDAVSGQPVEVIEQSTPPQPTRGTFCTKCGGSNPPKNKFCVKCGGDLTK